MKAIVLMMIAIFTFDGCVGLKGEGKHPEQWRLRFDSKSGALLSRSDYDHRLLPETAGSNSGVGAKSPTTIIVDNPSPSPAPTSAPNAENNGSLSRNTAKDVAKKRDSYSNDAQPATLHDIGSLEPFTLIHFLARKLVLQYSYRDGGSWVLSYHRGYQKKDLWTFKESEIKRARTITKTGDVYPGSEHNLDEYEVTISWWSDNGGAEGFAIDHKLVLLKHGVEDVYSHILLLRDGTNSFYDFSGNQATPNVEKTHAEVDTNGYLVPVASNNNAATYQLVTMLERTFEVYADFDSQVIRYRSEYNGNTELLWTMSLEDCPTSTQQHESGEAQVDSVFTEVKMSCPVAGNCPNNEDCIKIEYQFEIFEVVDVYGSSTLGSDSKTVYLRREPNTAPVTITDSNHATIVTQGSTWLIQFWESNCPNCNTFEPTYKEIATYFHVDQSSGVQVGKVNAASETNLATQYSVASVPSYFVVVDGAVVCSAVGSTTKDDLIAMVTGAAPECAA